MAEPNVVAAIVGKHKPSVCCSIVTSDLVLLSAHLVRCELPGRPPAASHSVAALAYWDHHLTRLMTTLIGKTAILCQGACYFMITGLFSLVLGRMCTWAIPP